MNGFGSYSYTTIQGKGNKNITVIAAYITVMKGSQIGVELLFARQVTLYESQCIRQGKCPSSSFSPRTTAIQSLNKIIEKFQKEHHAIILLIDANQSLQ